MSAAVKTLPRRANKVRVLADSGGTATEAAKLPLARKMLAQLLEETEALAARASAMAARLS
jgi:hypothetical protein